MKCQLLTLICILFTTTSLYSQETKAKASNEQATHSTYAMIGAHVDLMAGVAVPTGDIDSAIETRLGYGLQVLAIATPEFHIGAFYTTNNGSIIGFEEAKIRLSHYGVVAQYYLDPIFFVQARAGLSSLSAKAAFAGQSISISEEKNPIILGAGFGAKFPINQTVSFVPFLNFTHSFAAGTGTEDEINPYGLFEAVAAIRINF